jgi:hypothetical protein
MDRVCNIDDNLKILRRRLDFGKRDEPLNKSKDNFKILVRVCLSEEPAVLVQYERFMGFCIGHSRH